MIEFSIIVKVLMTILVIFLSIFAVLGGVIFKLTYLLYLITFAFLISPVLKIPDFITLPIILIVFNICIFIELKLSDIIPNLKKIDKEQHTSNDYNAKYIIILMGAYAAISILVSCICCSIFYENEYILKPQIDALETSLEDAEETIAIKDAEERKRLALAATKNKSSGFDVEGFRKDVDKWIASHNKNGESHSDGTHVNYIGNKKSHIVHEESCFRVSKISPENKIDFDTIDEALDKEYKFCRICMQ